MEEGVDVAGEAAELVAGEAGEVDAVAAFEVGVGGGELGEFLALVLWKLGEAEEFSALAVRECRDAEERGALVCGEVCKVGVGGGGVLGRVERGFGIDAADVHEGHGGAACDFGLLGGDEVGEFGGAAGEHLGGKEACAFDGKVDAELAEAVVGAAVEGFGDLLGGGGELLHEGVEVAGGADELVGEEFGGEAHGVSFS
jgi:hypothetical protein